MLCGLLRLLAAQTTHNSVGIRFDFTQLVLKDAPVSSRTVEFVRLHNDLFAECVEVSLPISVGRARGIHPAEGHCREQCDGDKGRKWLERRLGLPDVEVIHCLREGFALISRLFALRRSPSNHGTISRIYGQQSRLFAALGVVLGLLMDKHAKHGRGKPARLMLHD